MKLKIPNLAFVVLVGPSGSGKSTFAARHFGRFEVLSSDFCRGLVANDENVLDANEDAFDVLRAIAHKRLARGLLTVVDATNVDSNWRRRWVDLAREYHVLPVALAFNLPLRRCLERNETRKDRRLPPSAIIKQHREMRSGLRGLGKEGFRHVHVLEDEEVVDSVELVREPLWNDRRTESGPFDIIGDVHGCMDELVELLAKLGYEVQDGLVTSRPEGRRLVFVGDLVDRGPATPAVLRLVMRAVADGHALCVPGNHDIKLMRALRGQKVKVAHGLEKSLEQLAQYTDDDRKGIVEFIDDLVSHYVFDAGRLVVAHAGMKESMQGRGSGAVRDFALFGETTGETDEFGLPVRVNWAEEYRGRALVVYGHTPVVEPLQLNNTCNIDTGCVFGGKLTAYRYPEGALVSVSARAEHSVPARPLVPPAASTLTPQQLHDDMLYIEDALGGRGIETALRGRIKIREENAAAALETMSRFGVDPHWFVHLPPTMGPCETSTLEGFLEHPTEAFGYYAKQGIEEVVCETKHMGSRAIVVLCRDEEAASRRFGIEGAGRGAVFTRTGRRFFHDRGWEPEFLAHLDQAMQRSGTWDALGSDWICIDGELMPWSAKAVELLRWQYAPVAAAGEAMLTASVQALDAAAARGLDGTAPLLLAQQERLQAIRRYRQVYGGYCWEVQGIGDVRFAPFHILASEAGCGAERSHRWHLETLGRLVSGGDCPLLTPTEHRFVKLADPAAIEEATRWWLEYTSGGGEGMVVKPVEFVARAGGRLLQPAIKCRGAEYLRIIYGPEYLRPANMERLRKRGLRRKHELAVAEFALGVEALERFLRREPLRRVHECVLGLLALESEAVDPRL